MLSLKPPPSDGRSHRHHSRHTQGFNSPAVSFRMVAKSIEHASNDGRLANTDASGFSVRGRATASIAPHPTSPARVTPFNATRNDTEAIHPDRRWSPSSYPPRRSRSPRGDSRGRERSVAIDRELPEFLRNENNANAMPLGRRPIPKSRSPVRSTGTRSTQKPEQRHDSVRAQHHESTFEACPEPVPAFLTKADNANAVPLGKPRMRAMR